MFTELGVARLIPLQTARGIVEPGEGKLEKMRLAMIEACKQSDAEMLVLGSRGRGGFAGLLLGSVGQECAANAPCPVLICKANGDRPGA